MNTPQDKDSAQELREREVLRRMLNSPPKPHKPRTAPAKTPPKQHSGKPAAKKPE